MPKCPFPIRISSFSYLVNKSRILSNNPVKFSIHLRFYSSVSASPETSMEAENPSDAPISEEMFKLAPKMGSYKLGDSTFSSMIENYANSGDFASVEKLLSRIRLENRIISEHSFIVIFRAYGKAHLPGKAVDLFHRMVDEFSCKRTVKSFNSVLNVIINEGLYQRGLEFHNYVVNSNMNMNISPNGLSFNLVIKALCKLDKAVSLLERMVSSKCVPNDVTYGTLINGLVKQRRATDATRLLIYMEERGYCLNLHIYSVLISGLFKEGKAEEAMTLWKKMLEKGRPNIVVYSALVDGLCREGKPHEAKEILNEMISNKCLPNAYTYSTLMKGFFITGLSEEALQVWREMDETKCSQNEVCYSVLIDGLCGVGRVKEAMMVWSKMLTIGIKPDTVAYSSMIKGLCSIGSMDAALKLYHEMLCEEEPKSQPDVVTYNILINGLCMQKDVSRAVDLLNCMLEKGCDPDVITCNMFLITLGEKPNSCEEGRIFLEELVVRLLKRQRVSGACKIVEVMLGKYMAPKDSTWAMIVPEICKPKKINAAIDKCYRNLCT